MWNVHDVGAADKTQTKNLVLQKHKYSVKLEGCGNHKLIDGDDFHPDGRGGTG